MQDIQTDCQAKGDRSCAGMQGAEQDWKLGGGVQRVLRTYCSPAALADTGSLCAKALISHAGQCYEQREHGVV